MINSRILQVTPRESQLAKPAGWGGGMRSKSQCPPYFKVFVSKNNSEHFKAFRTNRDTGLSGALCSDLSTLYEFG